MRPKEDDEDSDVEEDIERHPEKKGMGHGKYDEDVEFIEKVTGSGPIHQSKERMSIRFTPAINSVDMIETADDENTILRLGKRTINADARTMTGHTVESTFHTPTTDLPTINLPSTDAEAIAKRWRHDQSTGMNIQHPDSTTVGHIAYHATYTGSQFLEKRGGGQDCQGSLGSNKSLNASTKISATDIPDSPLVTTCLDRRLSSPSEKTYEVFGAQASMSEDEVSIQIPSISMESTSLPLQPPQDRLRSSTSSLTEFSHNTDIEADGSGNIDSNLAQSMMLPSTKITDKKSSFKQAPTVQEQVIASRVSRSGKLFATKIKTIAIFEYNTAKKLGKGNFGIVYQGKHIYGKEEVAIKKITRKLPGEIEKLGLVQREMRVCRLFRDLTGIVPLLDIITTNKHHYLVFQKAEGDLAEMLRTRCRDTIDRRTNRDLGQQPPSPSCCLGTVFSVQEIQTIMRTVVLGLQVLHSKGYSHKDIKPANILFRDGQGLLCDFGLCSQKHELPENQFFGTQDYASPEARRVGGHRTCDYIKSDIYSLGAVLYELATGSVLSKVISHGLNWGKIAEFGGRDFSELLQGMVNDIEKRWDIDRVASSPFWGNASSSLLLRTTKSSTMGATTCVGMAVNADSPLSVTPEAEKSRISEHLNSTKAALSATPMSMVPPVAWGIE
ncbi:kinase-like domain-containing protein [Lobosporangium transversale]|uniref:non-specific serine/threonine protein kinase n=1 Tax=Lobosporangium transversale TaxID=64571 RepID=A0A1Y2GSY1_9FUNG|nr:kinase-like domain-containing protein [Lobosporangium transversale]ORZ16755.1 kinase-like domain-containing protein [Lobosporangium transversale]|eukprot:XP_021881690.1 kinase-like domain-containing protein [Lobosporangium transversale]